MLYNLQQTGWKASILFVLNFTQILSLFCKVSGSSQIILYDATGLLALVDCYARVQRACTFSEEEWKMIKGRSPLLVVLSTNQSTLLLFALWSTIKATEVKYGLTVNATTLWKYLIFLSLSYIFYVSLVIRCLSPLWKFLGQYQTSPVCWADFFHVMAP